MNLGRTLILQEPQTQSDMLVAATQPAAVEPEELPPAGEDRVDAENLENTVPVPLDEGLHRLQEALDQRDSKKQKSAGTVGATPKVKASPKGKAKAKPASKKAAAAPKSSSKPSKRCAKKGTAKSKVSKPGKVKKPQPKEPKMTRECVYSRAYHQAASNLFKPLA